MQDQLVVHLQVICLQEIQWANQDQWMADQEDQVIYLREKWVQQTCHQTEWLICIHIWMMRQQLMLLKDLLQ
jgi:hypothetical protein